MRVVKGTGVMFIFSETTKVTCDNTYINFYLEIPRKTEYSMV